MAGSLAQATHTVSQPLTYARTHLELLLLEVSHLQGEVPERFLAQLRESLGAALGELERASAALAQLQPQAPEPEGAGALSRPAPPPGGGRVLIIDDHVQVTEALKMLLDEEHEVLAAHSGTQALALLEQEPAFDLILCDLIMAGMSGMELHATLAQRWAGLEGQVVFMTGGAFTEEMQDFLQRVPNLVLEKPIASAALHKLIRERVAARAQPRPARP